jgi:hypothetical protein
MVERPPHRRAALSETHQDVYHDRNLHGADSRRAPAAVERFSVLMPNDGKNGQNSEGLPGGSQQIQ